MTKHLTKEDFLKEVFDFENNSEWKFAGEIPCLIDFYADWCAPCKMIAPILEEISEEYAGLINVYKVNTEEQQELAAAFGIRSIPSLLFVPKEGKPQMAAGALPKTNLEESIRDVLGVVKTEVTA
ncbi:MAG TPA: thioredoxin [Candidatus Marinimicrobia bacterium]|nr:thioredoxin [Candidatus Neomarinimicrobiota bacterium]